MGTLLRLLDDRNWFAADGEAGGKLLKSAASANVLHKTSALEFGEQGRCPWVRRRASCEVVLLE